MIENNKDALFKKKDKIFQLQPANGGQISMNELKTEIAKLSNIPDEDQQLFYNDIELKDYDNMLLSDYGIKGWVEKNETIRCRKMQQKVVTDPISQRIELAICGYLRNECGDIQFVGSLTQLLMQYSQCIFTMSVYVNDEMVNVDMNTHILNVKLNAKLEGGRRALLAFNGRLLENYATINECGIKHNDKLDLYSLYFIDHMKQFEVGIKEYNQYGMIKELKEKVGQSLDKEPDDLRFIWWGTHLEDGRCLSDYNMQKGAIIYVVIRLRAVIKELDDIKEEISTKQRKDSCILL